MPKLIYKGLEVGGVSNEAIQCHFDNTGSNITSDNVEAALKELDSKTAGLIQVTPEEYEALAPEEKASGLYIIIDDKLSADGINPVQNKVIANAINALTSNITFYAVNQFNEIPLSSELRVFSVLITDNADPNCPYPSGTTMWWNVLQFGHPARLTQIANQAFSTRPGHNELWVRTRHDNTWSAWRQIGGIKSQSYTLTLDATGNAQIPEKTISNTMPMALVITSGGNYWGNVVINPTGYLYAQAFDFGSASAKATNITIGCTLFYMER